MAPKIKIRSATRNIRNLRSCRWCPCKPEHSDRRRSAQSDTYQLAVVHHWAQRVEAMRNQDLKDGSLAILKSISKAAMITACPTMASARV